jgi:hypothetical protein
VRLFYSTAQWFDDRVHSLIEGLKTDLLSADGKHKLSKAEMKAEKSKTESLKTDICVSFGTFLDAFVLQWFLPKIKVDFRKRVETAIDHIDAWQHVSPEGRNAGANSDKLNVAANVAEILNDLADLHRRINGRHTAYILNLLCASTGNSLLSFFLGRGGCLLFCSFLFFFSLSNLLFLSLL